MLLVVAVLVAALWCTRYWWNRRRLYECARQRPGPLAFPFIGNVLYLAGRSKDIFDNVLKFHSVYQSPAPLWIGPHLFFVVWDPKNLKVILNNQDCLGKSFFYRYIEIAIGRGLITHPVPKWKRHRKMITPIFNKKLLDSFVEVFYEKALILSKRLEQYSGQYLDVFDFFSCYAFDVLIETGMGTQSNVQNGECDQAQWFNTLKEITFTRINNIFYHFDWIFKLTSYSKQFDEALNNIDVMIGSMVQEQIKLCQNKLESDIPTFLQKLIEATDNDGDFTGIDLREEMITFLIGGNDTVAGTLSYALMVLGMYPEIQRKVYAEVRDSVGLEKSITHLDVPYFRYLDRVLKETLRLFPPAPCVSREVNEDIRLENCVIPRGCSLGIGIVALHRDPAIWPDPLKFDPDRFLPDYSRDPYSWLPFSGGPRNCVAFKYAIAMMKVAIATLVRKYQFSSTYKDVSQIKFKANLLLKPIDGYKVMAELRK